MQTNLSTTAISEEIAANQDNFFDINESHCATTDLEHTKNTFELESETNNSAVSQFIGEISTRISSLLLSHEETNQVYKICMELIDKTQQLNEMFMKEENGINSFEALKMSTAIIREELLQSATRYKRDKQFKGNKFYVAPEEKAIGLRWTSSKLPDSFVLVPRLVPSVFHEISLVKSIISLFERDDFRKEYLLYNEQQAKLVSNNVYSSFSSGRNFKSNQLFTKHPDSLQIEIGQDDFEPCNALGSRATVYKLSPVYITVKNIPPKFSSKLSNILLSSLCHTDDLKTSYTDWNDIWLGIVAHLRQIEDGIVLNDGTTIRGTVTSVVSDNLGANTILGFVKNFSKTKYPCRFCLCSLDEIRTVSKEIPSQRRTKEHYEEQLLKIKASEKVDLTNTFGVVMHCALNELKFYNTINSMTPDIMHDVNEGAIPYLLKPLFEYLFKYKVCTENELKNKIKFHNFGFNQKKNVPAELSISKACLGQNASQILCLFQSIPFILYDYKDNEVIEKVWVCVSTLLKITQIVHSERIDDDDLKDLVKFVEIHIESFLKIFKNNLKFKQHNLIHFASTIEAMGPLKSFSMKRYEAKHKELKGCIGDSHNYRNLTKTIAERHQQMMSMKKNTYTDYFEHAKIMKLIDKDFFNHHKKIVQTALLIDDGNEKEIFELKWMIYNSFRYDKGFYIQFNNHLYKIEKVLFSNNEYYFFCLRAVVIEYCPFLNSIKVEIFEPNLFEVIKFDSLENKNVYEAKVLNKENYIILDTLDLKSLYK